MNTFDIILILAGVCGVIMVGGGIVLLYKGAITLATTGGDGLSVEFKKYFKITTQYPALGIFVIGLGFIGIALWTSKPSAVRRIEVRGKTDAGPITAAWVRPSAWKVETIPNNELDGIIYPDVSLLYLEVTAPGHYGSQLLPQKSVINGVVDLGVIPLRQVTSRIRSDSNNIEAPGFHAPPPSAPGSYGAGATR